MMSAADHVTWADVVYRVAAEFGTPMTAELADFILWERTGFPAFWRTNNPTEECAEQVRRYLRAGVDLGFLSTLTEGDRS